MQALRRVFYQGFQSIEGICCLLSAAKVPFQQHPPGATDYWYVIEDASSCCEKPESLISHLLMGTRGHYLHDATHPTCDSKGFCSYRLSSLVNILDLAWAVSSDLAWAVSSGIFLIATVVAIERLGGLSHYFD